MEGVATTSYSGFRSYGRRKGYCRLNPSTTTNNKTSSDFSRRRFGNPKPRLKLRRFRFKFGLGSVRNFFLKIRDAYVNAMLGFASKGMIYGRGYGFGGAGDGGMSGFGGKGHLKEYDERMLVEIYKRIVLNRQQQGIVATAGCPRGAASEVASVQ